MQLDREQLVIRVYRHVSGNKNAEHIDIPPRMYAFLMSLDERSIKRTLIIEDLKHGKPCAIIADRYGVNQTTVWRIRQSMISI